MAAPYQLRCQIFGHSKDVRAVTPAIIPENAVVSGSRDATARVWVEEEDGKGYREGHFMSGHKNFVSSVCCMPPDDKYPHGLIFTGSNDNTILAFTLDSPQHIFQLAGHSGTVCSMAAGKFGTLLSGSWDKTAKVWLHQKCVMTLEGHQSAVWAVAIMPEQGVMLTGSADKTIKVWKAGKCENTITGHDDCVRGLAVTQGCEFLSCSNDATVRRWLVTGECIAVYYGHENFVYSLAVLQNGQDFVSSGEDRTVRVWKDGECRQTINHPCLSIWSLCVMANGDIVSVFTCDPARFASTEELKTYDEQIAQSQEYDYVFSVDIEEGKPPLKLPYNLTEDPWFAAQMFIEKNNLSQAFLDQVANFITENTKGATLTQGSGASYADPFTGGNRYVPGSSSSTSTEGADPFTGGGRYIPGGSSAPSAGGGGGGADPFTGGGRYVPSYNGEQTGTGGAYTTGTVNPNLSKRNEFFPKETTLTFDAANPAQIMGKLREFNGTVEAGLKVDDKLIEGLEGLLHRDLPSEDNLNTLRALLLWPNNCVFPALDVLRITIKTQEVNVAFCVKDDILAAMMKFWTPENSVPNQVLSLKVVCNMFAQPQGFKLCMDNREKIVNSAIVIKDSKNKNVHIGLGTLILNFSVALFGSLDLEGKKKTLQAASECLKSKPDPEAAFRLFIAMGTLIHKDENIQKLAKSLGIANMLGDYLRVSEPAKISSCANFMQDLLR
ncbi:PLAP-like protein [Mya arenaria]|uniref:PLAP-like protein n=1 Tax=Mya arenaria TaxID=6604 RepID=A0ABY7FQU4_MYAAR|nr:PLAP-like protein [Mya arenaria]